MTNWINALMGGVLIGASATLLLAFNGRIAGISGIFNQAIAFIPSLLTNPLALEDTNAKLKIDRIWSWCFLGGMLGGGAIYVYILAPGGISQAERHPGLLILSGFLVGFGTRMANGCTSGHGVCGLGRLSPRSLVAVITFLSTAMMTVFVTRHW